MVPPIGLDLAHSTSLCIGSKFSITAPKMSLIRWSMTNFLLTPMTSPIRLPYSSIAASIVSRSILIDLHPSRSVERYSDRPGDEVSERLRLRRSTEQRLDEVDQSRCARGYARKPNLFRRQSCGNGGGLILTGQQGNNFWVQVELFSGS